ncbi:hypothetical protein AB1Y20_019772 [Prymnesium parvum]|uniref:Ammonium transporter AmtB-like domain-containing protein n=1 Tax=Prymnesium parvum TaxID=97485 RepID=A0AB34JV19_PRYPA
MLLLWMHLQAQCRVVGHRSAYGSSSTIKMHLPDDDYLDIVVRRLVPPVPASPQCSMADTTTRSEPLLSEASQSFWEKHMFSLLLGVVHIALLFFYAFFTTTNPEEDYLERYGYLVGVTLMMFVGFGYLMTFLRWYGLGAVGLTMIITCLGLELAVLFEGIFFTTDGSKLINIDLHALLNGDFAVAAFLISFGGLIGKVGPSQLVVLVVCETFAYVANKQLILIRWLDIRDAGGTITIHMFGAYFGLAVALVIGKPAKMEKEKASISSDLTSLIGTTFLWLYWPSFVAGDLKASEGAPLALVNTIISLIGSTVATFIVSPLLSNGKIRPVDIQNAALAGGVAIGAVANLDIKPFGALIIGSLAGVVSTVGFCKVQERLFRMGLHDTCGIHNLHGMPSLLGGLASVFTAVAGIQRAGTAGHQLAGIGLTLLTSICSGLLTGGLLLPFRAPSMNMADDSVHWEVADDFESCAP